ncbi:TetR/AcrR family transcriptional regulator [Streptomyces sp. NBC_01803]|uniref:TetR/AcrR family transcriptional regulator n=1 Tax=Streptomyces sp. NBC_01803 TaxID=2975946 RepID=UPI002DDAA64B|nr:TetR/AcrR family transcriptional regulator [Streptomyces sp. NBC_01803]WSA45038.1 TetR/AcrR family transcriptional regulator [Streptomyces sp. NBC_01803]
MSDQVPMRERILVEAARLFARVGYRAASTRDIAAAVGVRQPSLFHHFPSKASILSELLAYSYGPTVRTCEHLAALPGPAAPRLYAYVSWDLTYIHRSPYDLHGLHTDEVLGDPAFAASETLAERLHAGLRRIVAQGAESGEFVVVEPRLAQEMITGVLLANIRVRQEGWAGGPERAGELAEAGASFVLRGLLPGGDRAYAAVRDAGRALWPALEWPAGAPRSGRPVQSA